MYFQAIVNSFCGLGPFCFNFSDHESHTVLDLKKKLEIATSVNADEQRIKTMGGRLLNDHDILFQNGLKEPAIFNLTVRMVGGLQRRVFESHLQETRISLEQPIKRQKTNTDCRLSYDTGALKEGKGKQKQTRKRKYNEA